MLNGRYFMKNKLMVLSLVLFMLTAPVFSSFRIIKNMAKSIGVVCIPAGGLWICNEFFKPVQPSEICMESEQIRRYREKVEVQLRSLGMSELEAREKLFGNYDPNNNQIFLAPTKSDLRLSCEYIPEHSHWKKSLKEKIKAAIFGEDNYDMKDFWNWMAKINQDFYEKNQKDEKDLLTDEETNRVTIQKVHRSMQPSRFAQAKLAVINNPGKTTAVAVGSAALGAGIVYLCKKGYVKNPFVKLLNL